MQYDSPVQKTALTATLNNENANLSSLTIDAISSLLNLEGEGTVGIAGIQNGAAVLPTTGTAQIVHDTVTSTDGAPVVLDLSAAENAGVNAFFLQSSDNLVVNLQGQQAAQARVAVADEQGVTADNQAQYVVATGNGNDNITVAGDQNTLVDAGNGNNIVNVTGNGNNTVIAQNGDNTITTGAGDDLIVIGGTGSDVIDTGAGYDVVQIEGDRDASELKAVNGTLSLSGDKNASIKNAEFLKFVDADGETTDTVALANSNEEAAVLRLYQAVLNRDADEVGAKGFTQEVNNGTSLTELADRFLNSSEYTNKQTATDVQELYQSLLGRTAEADEVTAWQAQFDKGVSFEQFVSAVVLSNESIDNDQSNGAFVESLYTNILGRDAEDGAVDAWVAQLFSGTSRVDVVNGFLNSSENASNSNEEFITSLYQNALGRAPEEAGKDGWLAALEAGASKADVALGIVGSQEAADHVDNVVVLHGQV